MRAPLSRRFGLLAGHRAGARHGAGRRLDAAPGRRADDRLALRLGRQRRARRRRGGERKPDRGADLARIRPLRPADPVRRNLRRTLRPRRADARRLQRPRLFRPRTARAPVVGRRLGRFAGGQRLHARRARSAEAGPGRRYRRGGGGPRARWTQFRYRVLAGLRRRRSRPFACAAPARPTNGTAISRSACDRGGA